MEKKSNTEFHGSDRYLCFTLGKDEFAMPLLSVREVIALPEITPVPQSPPYFLGIMNLRGQVISILDLRTKLNIKPKENAEISVIICDMKPNNIGVVVDSINSVIHPKPEQLSEKPELQNQKSSEYVEGVFRDDKRLVLLLDITKTLNLTDQHAIQKAAASKSTKVA